MIITVIGSLGQGNNKPALAVQNALLKWIICVYDIVVDSKTLSRLYGVLFSMLDMISLR